MAETNNEQPKQPTIAPGLEDDELHRDATEEEIRRGDFTQVVRLSWDENDNGSFESTQEDR